MPDATRRFVCTLAGALALGLASCASAQRGGEGVDQLRRDTRRLFAGARDRVYPALVHISVVTAQHWDGREIKGRAAGSGTIISPEGYVLTNQHVTSGGESFTCTLADRQEIPAALVGEDALTDIAVLRLDLDALAPGTTLPTAEFGDSDDIEVGDYVMAMGSPFSLSRSVTLGIVSNTARVFGGGVGATEIEEVELESGQRTGLFTTWIQHDALIHPGNSGGPLVNLRGRIIGVNELGGSSMGFAIPSNLASQIAGALIEHGRVERSWIGLSVRPVRDAGRADGALVSSVVEDSPAGRADLRPGDVLLSLDDEPVQVRFIEEIPALLKRIADEPVGTTLTLRIEREGEPRTLAVVTEPMRDDLGDEVALRSWGLTAQEITPRMAMRRRLEGTSGALVSSVRSGGPGEQAEPAIAPGDVIRGVEGEPVETLADLTALFASISESDDAPERLLVQFERGGENHFTLLRPDDGRSVDPPRELPKAWLGVATQPIVSNLATRLGLPEEGGYRVTRVHPGTTAAASDLRTGDLILSMDGVRLSPRSAQDAGLLARAVRRGEIGEASELLVLRDGKRLTIGVALEASPMPPSEAKREQNQNFGLSVRDVTFYDRDQRRWPTDRSGVLVEGVETGGWADDAGVRSGELILEIAGDAIADIEDFRRVMRELDRARPERVEVITLRGVSTRVLFMEPDWSPEPASLGAPDDATASRSPR